MTTVSNVKIKNIRNIIEYMISRYFAIVCRVCQPATSISTTINGVNRSFGMIIFILRFTLYCIQLGKQHGRL